MHLLISIRVLAGAMVMALVGCGGGGGGNGTPPAPPPPSGGSNTNPPAAVDFSIIGVLDDGEGFSVDGVSIDLGNAMVTLNGTPGVAADLQPGQAICVVGERHGGQHTASEIIYNATVIGPVEFNDAGNRRLVVAGQTVVIDDYTVTPTDLGDINSGQFLEISGFRGPLGAVIATRVDVVASQATVSIDGRASDVDANTNTFALNGVEVDYTNALVREIPGGALDDGARVLVTGELSADRLAATDIRGVDPSRHSPAGSDVQITGTITRFHSAADFEVEGDNVVVTSETLLTNALPSDLTAGIRVTVVGTRDEHGRIRASRVRNLGAGGPGSSTFDFKDFRALEVGGGWNLKVERGADFAVELSYGEDITNVLDARQTGETLVIGFRNDVVLEVGPTRLDALVTMPSLARLVLSGGTQATIADFVGERFSAELRGASSIEADGADFASVELALAGSSQVHFADVRPLHEATVDLSNASEATLNLEIGAKVAGSAANNSTFYYYGDDVDVDMTLSSGGTVSRLGTTR